MQRNLIERILGAVSLLLETERSRTGTWGNLLRAKPLNHKKGLRQLGRLSHRLSQHGQIWGVKFYRPSIKSGSLLERSLNKLELLLFGSSWGTVGGKLGA